jgi:hypothetical protein
MSFKEILNSNNAVITSRMKDLIDTITTFLISTSKEDDTGKNAIAGISKITLIGKINSKLHFRRKKELISIEFDFSSPLPIRLSTAVSDKFENIL